MYICVYVCIDPIGVIRLEPECAKTGEEITIIAEGIQNLKSSVRFEHTNKISVQVAGKFNKERNAISCKVPLIEYKHSGEGAKPDEIQIRLSISFNDGIDWSINEGVLRYKL